MLHRIAAALRHRRGAGQHRVSRSLFEATVHGARRVLLVAVLVAAPACGSDSSTGPGPGPDQPSLVGQFYLTKVSNAELPAKIHHGPFFDGEEFHNQLIVTIQDGDVIFEKDGTFSIWFEAYFVGNQFWVDELWIEGTYEVDGQNVRLIPYVGAEQWAVFKIDQFTVSMDLMGVGNTFTYRFEK